MRSLSSSSCSPGDWIFKVGKETITDCSHLVVGTGISLVITGLGPRSFWFLLPFPCGVLYSLCVLIISPWGNPSSHHKKPAEMCYYITSFPTVWNTQNNTPEAWTLSRLLYLILHRPCCLQYEPLCLDIHYPPAPKTVESIPSHAVIMAQLLFVGLSVPCLWGHLLKATWTHHVCGQCCTFLTVGACVLVFSSQHSCDI